MILAYCQPYLFPILAITSFLALPCLVTFLLKPDPYGVAPLALGGGLYHLAITGTQIFRLLDAQDQGLPIFGPFWPGISGDLPAAQYRIVMGLSFAAVHLVLGFLLIRWAVGVYDDDEGDAQSQVIEQDEGEENIDEYIKLAKAYRS
jgi:nitrogen fixation-related uncharacterized protein